MSHPYEFDDVRFPADYAALLEMTKNIIRTNRRLAAIVGDQYYAIQAMIDAVDNDDGHRLAQLLLEYKTAQAAAEAIVDAQNGAGITAFPVIH